ncbi:alpha/beta fold hydrolase [Sphingosinicella sp. CPCC 101087]|uniref:alpha/beta fold hydrolase n=1 Tax=Sphingosinicella sp. CPCC 101087 TaxID=2497754 RepID=UPI00101CB4C4|nr:alpha/beta hydrolase [Sphingosinicella sp. CPCC 101087]
MTAAKSRNSTGRDQAPSSDQGAPLWTWGAAGAAAAALGAAAFNINKARRAEESNPPLGRFIDVDGVALHYLEEGSGPLVVLLHGNGTAIDDWIASGIFERLAATNRVIAFDRPGFGHSRRPRSIVWTPDAQARLIASALSSLGATEAIVVGHSFGAMVAVALGLDHPEIATSLVLIGGYYYPTARLDAVLAAPPALPLLGDAIRLTVSPLLGAALRNGAEKQMFAPAPVSSGWSNGFPFEMTLRPSQIRAGAADAAIMIPAAASLAPRVPELRMPVTIISGRGDKVVTPAEQSERLSAALPQSRLIMVEGAGHMVHHTAADEVAAAIRGEVRPSS